MAQKSKTFGDETEAARPSSTPASPAMSINSPNLSQLPGAMPSFSQVVRSEPAAAAPATPKARALPLSTPSSSSASSSAAPAPPANALSSFLRSLSINTTTTSPSDDTNGGVTMSKHDRRSSSPTTTFRSGSPDLSSPNGRPSPVSPSTPVLASPLQGGASFKRVGSQSSTSRPFRRLSGALPSLLGPNSPISQGRAGSPATRTDGEQTPTQANASSSSGLFSSSISFLSNLASLDKLPPMLGMRAAEKDVFPRGTSEIREEDEMREGEDLRIEEAIANGTTDSGIAVGTAEDAEYPDPVSRTNTLATLDSETSTRYPLSPAASIGQANPVASSSDSLSSSHDEGLGLAAEPSKRLPMQQHRRNSTLDPLTFQAITRTSSEAEAMRVARERAQRDRQLDLQERIKREAANPVRRAVPSLGGEEGQGADPARQDTLRSPVRVGEKDERQDKTDSPAIGLGRPPAQILQTPEPKKRKKSLFGRLGFSPKSPKTPPVATSAAPLGSPGNLPSSRSASSFGSFGSFAAVAEAVPTRPGPISPRANSSLSKSSTLAVPEEAAASREQLDRTDDRADTGAQDGAAIKPERGRYVKTKVKNKSKREFNHLFLAQELYHQSAVTALSETMPTTSLSPLAASPSKKDKALPPSPGAQYATYPEKASASALPGTPATAASKRGRPGASAIWSLKISPDGNYLASAGQDGIVRVWQVISGSEEREAAVAAATRQRAQSISVPETAPAVDADEKGKHGRARSGTREKKERTCKFCSSHDITCPGMPAHANDAAATAAAVMPIFANEPLHEWTGHASDVLDLSWSKNNFLLSSSMDKTVRLWHVSRKECLCAFQHLDFVTSIAFHPRDDRYFISGSLDAKLRLWSIPDKKVHCWTQLPELITCVSFTTDGKLAIAGTFVGLCLFFEVHDLSFVTKLHSKSTRGKNAKGRKITSIVPFPKAEPSEPERLLITSNDSRIRLWNVEHIVAAQANGMTATTSLRILPEKHLEAKYRFHENASSQIKASFSDDGRYVISGSEDRQAYLWQSGLLDFPAPFAQSSKKTADKSPGYETFSPAPALAPASGVHTSALEASVAGTAGIVTCAIFVPLETKLTLARDGDPLLGESSEDQRTSAAHLRRSASHASTTSSLCAPASASGRSDEGSLASATTSSADGCIIITADDQSGVIRVYRNNAIFKEVESGKTRDRKNSNLTDRSESGGNDKRASFFSQTSSNGSGGRRFSIISRTTTTRTRHSTNDKAVHSEQTRTLVKQNDLEELA